MRDVIIVGAGPAGSALAYFLAAQGVDVLLLDKAEFPRDKTCGDGLTPRALGVLRTMGLLDTVLEAGFKINGVHIHMPDGRLISAPVPAWGDLPRFAFVLPRVKLDDLIRRHAVQAGAEFQPRTEATRVLREGGICVGVAATTPAGPCELRARCTVLATGAAVALLERADLLAPPIFGRAARGYYHGMAQLSDYLEFHLEAVPLPGYAWVFPISPTAANVGAGYLVPSAAAQALGSPRKVLEAFLANPTMASRLAGARQDGPVKGYPLRFDFPRARLSAPGVLLIGEAAGLVNPLTGEGIDYALESAESAAEVLSAGLRRDTAPAALAEQHQRALRERFLRAFQMITRVRNLYFRPWILGRFGRAAQRHDDFRLTFIQVCLGNVDPAQGISPRMLWQVASS